MGRLGLVLGEKVWYNRLKVFSFRGLSAYFFTKECACMIYFPILLFCAACLFMALLQDRFRLPATVGVMGGAYIIASIVSSVLGGGGSVQLPAIVGTLILLLASVFVHGNNILQKLFVAVLSMANLSFLLLFIPLLLGVMPFGVAGAPGGVISVLAMVLFYLLMGLCLYRPMQRFAQRGPSVFLVGMTVLCAVQYLLCLGRFDTLFGIEDPIRRLFLAVIVYCVMIFCFRSVYQAGRWQSQAARQEARERMIEMESADYLDMLAAVRLVRSAHKTGEYALDTVNQLLREGRGAEVPAYIASYKHTALENPILGRYHENPYISAVIATKAAFAAQNQIDFQCNAAAMEGPVKTAELCILTDELLTRAMRDAAEWDGPRRLRFTAIPGEDFLRLEVIYSGRLPGREKLSIKGKSFGEVLRWLFDDPAPEDNEMRGLTNSTEIALSHSGSLTVSEAGSDGVIIRAALKF